MNCGPERGELLRGLLSLLEAGSGVEPLEFRRFSGIILKASAAFPGAGGEDISPSLLPVNSDSGSGL